MPRSETNTLWMNYENDTLIHSHKMAKIYKKRYQRASDFQNSLYRFFGLITVVSSAVASTLSWGIGSDSDSSEGGTGSNQLVVSTITTVAAVSAAVQNFYKFQENANNNVTTAKAYAKLQNKIESVGNIHPEYRVPKPNSFLKKIQDKFDQISDNRVELSNCMTRHLYTKVEDEQSYLEMKHAKYNSLQGEEKLDYTTNGQNVNVQIDTDESDDDENGY